MSTADTTIFIIGAGVGGITFAVGLRRQFPGFADFKICEKAPGLGGTWRVNTYPGCASDVPIMFFTHSASLSPKWRGTHGLQPEILGYWDDLTAEYDIQRFISFNTAAISATWDDSAQVWNILTKNSRGEEHTTRAKVLVSAAGFLEIPRMPDIPGLDAFKGAMFHSGTWDHSVKLSEKRVAVIGYGASAAQLIPELLKDTSTDVVQFCRTPSWFLWNPAHRVVFVRHYLRLRVTKHRKALTRLLLSDHPLALEQLRRADRYHPLVPRNERLCRLCGLSVESPEHAILVCEGDPDLVALRGATLTLLAPKLPHLKLVLPIDPQCAVDTLRALVFQDICLPLVAKLVYEIMEFFKGFELERPRYDKPLPILRTWHRRVPGYTPTRSSLPNAQMESDSDSDSDYIP